MSYRDEVSVANQIANHLVAGLKWAWSKARADHQPIQQGWPAIPRVDMGGGRYFLAHAACAPHRFRGKQAIDYRAAQDLASALLPPAASNLPVHSELDIVRFADPDEGGRPTRILEIRASGRVDLLTAMEPAEHENGPRLLLISVFEPMAALVQVICDGAYDSLFPRARITPRRFDWMFNLSPTRSGDSGTEPWHGLLFPGPEPSGRAHSQSAWAPPQGFGGDALQSVRRRKSQIVLDHALGGLLAQTGYLGWEDVIEPTVKAVFQRPQQRS